MPDTSNIEAALKCSDELPASIAQRLKRDSSGLICAVVQDADNGQVLMVGYMDDIALARTLSSARAWFWSRSRQEYWRKGDTSGHIQEVHSVDLDCDGDAVLVRVTQTVAACHVGTRSCFEAGGSLMHTETVAGHETGMSDKYADK